jgi:hypothetical protein
MRKFLRSGIFIAKVLSNLVIYVEDNIPNSLTWFAVFYFTMRIIFFRVVTLFPDKVFFIESVK